GLHRLHEPARDRGGQRQLRLVREPQQGGARPGTDRGVDPGEPGSLSRRRGDVAAPVDRGRGRRHLEVRPGLDRVQDGIGAAPPFHGTGATAIPARRRLYGAWPYWSRYTSHLVVARA